LGELIIRFPLPEGGGGAFIIGLDELGMFISAKILFTRSSSLLITGAFESRSLNSVPALAISYEKARNPI
jgi:hypothetical protein